MTITNEIPGKDRGPIARSIAALGAWYRGLASSRRGLAGFGRDRAGSVALIFGFTMIPVAIAAGMAMDVARAHIVKSRLAYALDAAGLAVGSSAGTEEELNLVLRDYFDANYPVAELGVPATPSMQIVDSEIHLAATATLKTMLMSVVGIREIEVAVGSVIVRETKGLDVVMVLDNTGSMAGSKMTSLKNASRTLVDILFGDNAEAERLKIGVVPFATAVNIGRGMIGIVDGVDDDDFDPDIWRGCVEARAAPHDSRDSDTDVGGLWAPYFWESNDRNNWETFGVRGSRGEIRGPNKDCPVELRPLTNQKAPILATIDAMDARGNTHIGVGAVWGWRVLSPDAPFTEGAAYDDPETVKAAIVMTDGDNTISSNCDNYGAYATLCDGRLGTTSQSQAENELDDRLTAVCEGMKEVGITVYTITFQLNSASTQALMRNCATDPNKYYNSPTNSDLERVFRAIGAELSNLRIGQ